jgi:hypothetical protein
MGRKNKFLNRIKMKVLQIGGESLVQSLKKIVRVSGIPNRGGQIATPAAAT